MSRQEGLDPVGACVGLSGIRIQNIVNELNGERIDVVEWDDDPARFVANALSPAHVSHVRIHEEEKTAEVIVPDRMLSLAIGKQGQNARLAAKLTGWRIDIKSESVAGRIPTPEPETPTKGKGRAATPEQEFVEPLEVPAEEAVPAEEVRIEEPAAPVAAAPEKSVRFAEDLLTPRTEEPGRKKAKGKKAATPSLRDDEDEVRAKKPKKAPRRAAVVVEDDDYDFAAALDQYDTDEEAEYKEDDY